MQIVICKSNGIFARVSAGSIADEFRLSMESNRLASASGAVTVTVTLIQAWRDVTTLPVCQIH